MNEYFPGADCEGKKRDIFKAVFNSLFTEKRAASLEKSRGDFDSVSGEVEEERPE
jgi:hypothetical protein